MLGIKKTKKGKILKILIIMTIALIWGQSFLPPDMSSDESGFVLEKIVKPILSFITGREAEISEHLVRKMAHFTEFMVLGILTALEMENCANKIDSKCVMRNAQCVLFCFFIAFIDESIQMFTGRGPAIADVWIDTFGAVAGAFIVMIISKRKNRTRREGTV